MINWALAFTGIVLTYVCWSVSMTSWSRLAELGISNNKSSTSFFDALLSGTLIGGVLARIVWMVTHLSLYQDVPWGILPYSRTVTEFVWFTVFPWRLFRITEGIMFPALWILMGIIAVTSIFIPTINLARRLRIEKRGVMRTFVINNALCALATVIYFATLTYFAW